MFVYICEFSQTLRALEGRREENNRGPLNPILQRLRQRQSPRSRQIKVATTVGSLSSTSRCPLNPHEKRCNRSRPRSTQPCRCGQPLFDHPVKTCSPPRR